MTAETQTMVTVSIPRLRLPGALAAVLHVLRIRSLRRYLAGQSVSLVGTWIQATTLSWVVWDISRSETALGLVGLLTFAPFVFAAPAAGLVTGRLGGRRRALIAINLAGMFMAAVFAALLATSMVRLWQLYLLSFGVGTVGALEMPVHQTYVGELAGDDRLRDAVAFNAALVQIARMAGPAVGGWLLAAIGPVVTIMINVGSYAATLVALATLRQDSPPSATPQARGSLRRGVAYLHRQRRLADLVVIAFLITFFGIGALQLLPALADQLRAGPELLGLLLGASGAGALVGTVILLPLANRLPRTGAVVAIAAIWSGAAFALLAIAPTDAVAVAASFAAGLTPPVVLTTTSSLMQLDTPEPLRTPALAALHAATLGSQPLSLLLLGLIADMLGVRTAIGLAALALTAGVATVYTTRTGLRTWTQVRPHGASDDPAAARIDACRASA